MAEDKLDKILNELETLKKLKVFELLEKGYSQARLAKTLGVSQPTISRMIPKEKAAKKNKADE